MTSPRLAAVLRIRRLQEQQERGRLAIANLERRRAEEAEGMARAEVAHAFDHVTDGSAQRLLAARARADAGMGVVERRTAVTVDARSSVLRHRHDWSLAARRVDALERLDERLVAAARAEHERREHAEHDDLAAGRHRAAADGPGGPR